MTTTTELKPVRLAPTIIKTDDGKSRTSTGRWSLKAIANYVNDHPATMFDYKQLARVGHGCAFPKQAEAARNSIRAIANLLESRGILTVVEFTGRKINAIQVYNRDNEYHQLLMAAEIGRRKVRADGSEEKLERLLQSLPPALPEG
jgi:hypothetical protein